MQPDLYLRGRMLVLCSGFVMSLGAPLIRLLRDAHAWQFLSYRSAAVAVIVALALIVTHQRELGQAMRKAGLMSLGAGALLAVTFISIVFALLTTTIANALFLLSTAPMLTAILGWLFLREAVSSTSVLAIACAMAGVSLMLGEGLAAGDVFGDLAGLTAALTFACYSVVLRAGRETDMLPALLYAALLSGFIAAGAALHTGIGLQISSWDMGVSFAYGGIGLAGGLYLYTLGSRFVPALELNVLSLGEMLLAPFWVWLAFAETPSIATLLGGGAIGLGLLIQAAGDRLARFWRIWPYGPQLVMCVGGLLMVAAVTRAAWPAGF